MATTISGVLTADNAFYAYISTNDSVLGTLVAQGNNWPSTFTFSGVALAPGVTNYLHIEAINYGAWAGFVGQFTMSDTGFAFGNGSQTLLTDTTHWAGSYNDANYDPSAPQPWIQPTGGVTSFGPNGYWPWPTPSGINSAADWIWPDDSRSLPGGSYGACEYCTIDLSTPINPQGAPSPVPEPGTLVLFGSGIVALAGAVRRKLA